jgi:predicted O-methyltransferase YrrM
MTAYKYTNSWFQDNAKDVWDNFIPIHKPKKVLEIGSYEGASSCYLISKITEFVDLEIHCIDTWKGGFEHNLKKSKIDMNAVRKRFKYNMKLAQVNTKKSVDIFIHIGKSEDQLPKLINKFGNNYFDFIYIDGSHIASDVLRDAILSFSLVKVGGHIVFDDYLWSKNQGLERKILDCPKVAIDSFVNIFSQHIEVLPLSIRQIFIKKTRS